MKDFMKQNSLTEMTGPDRKHHEIYISDPGKTKPEKMNTVIRLPVAKNSGHGDYGVLIETAFEAATDLIDLVIHIS
jgi:Uncharacterized conserved protein